MAERNRGVSGSTVGLIIFAILFVFALAGGIFAWNKASSEETQRLAQKAELDKLIGGRDRSDPVFEKLQALPKQGGQTVVGVLTEQYKARDSKANVAEADLAKTAAKLKDAEQRADKATADWKDANTKIAQMDDARKKEVTALNGQLDAANKSVTATKAELQNFTGQVTVEYKKHDDRLAKVTGDFTKQVADLTAANKALQEKLTADDSELERLRRPKIKGETAAKLIFTPDGKVASAPTDDGITFIDLGHSKHVALGMTFEVYDPTTVIEQDQYGDLRGKATIEIVRIMDDRSMVRIVRTGRGQHVNPGDVIANVAYDPNMTLKFFVFGDFDIDRTGALTPTDRKRIEGMIVDWGGAVADRLNYETDYVVLGSLPRRPDPLATGETDTRKIADFKQSEEKYNNYQLLIGEATGKHLPVLNQNQFLQLVGYYQRLAPNDSSTASR